MKEWHKKYNWFYEKWWKDNKDQIIPGFLENLTPEDKASKSEEEWVEWIKEKYRECVIDQCFWLENYTETHKGDLEESLKEGISKVCEMMWKDI